MSEIILERELYFEDARIPSVAEIFPGPVLQLNSHHCLLSRIVKQVGQCIISMFKCIIIHAFGIADINHRITDGAAEFIVPLLVNERNYAQNRKGDSQDLRYRL